MGVDRPYVKSSKSKSIKSKLLKSSLLSPKSKVLRSVSISRKVELGDDSWTLKDFTRRGEVPPCVDSSNVQLNRYQGAELQAGDHARSVHS